MMSREKILTVRLTQSELEHVSRSAKAAGLPVSAYIRKSTLGQRLRPQRGYFDSLALHELSMLAVELDRYSRGLLLSNKSEDPTRFLRVMLQHHIDTLTADDHHRKHNGSV